MERVIIWTDGSCLNNGTQQAASGIGVYYGRNDTRNYSSALKLDKHTNNRAELAAILYAICMDFNKHNMSIRTDSMYSVNCILNYAPKWQTAGWVTSKGTPVESAGMIKYILHLISERKALGLKTELEHVKAHSVNAGNNAADLLARTGATSGKEGGRLRMLRYCGIPV
jgi:ribonuclease HI